MKKSLIFVFIFLLCLTFTHADIEEDINTYKNADLNLKISSTIYSNYDSNSNQKLDNLDAEIVNFPRDNEFLDILSITTNPKSEIQNNGIFNWETLKDEYPILIDANIRTHGNEYNINKKIPYPLKNLPADIAEYKKPTEHIDSDNKDMRIIASELVNGKDDLFDISFTLAKWTHENIDYDLSTVTADANMPASWVLENKKGVCDELTNLYVAMLRSIGIPARVVVGIAYTNSDLFNYNWGPHAWAEVYFPEIGWVPFDVTYEQFGYIDNGHIKLADDYDAKSSSLKYSWVGYGIDMSADPLKYVVKEIDFKNKQNYPIDLKINFHDVAVKPGSYNLIKLKVTNNGDFYLPYHLYISDTESIEYFEPNTIIDFLKPREEKIYYRRIKVSNDLEKNYIYTFPIAVYSNKGNEEKNYFTSGSQDTYYTYNDIIIPTVGKILNDNDELKVECHNINEKIYTLKDASIECEIQNTGNTFLKGIKTCLDSCETFDLLLNEIKIIKFNPQVQIGMNEYIITTSVDSITTKNFANIDLFDIPKYNITNISINTTNEYAGDLKLSFEVSKESYSEAANMSVKIYGPFENAYWEIDNSFENKVLTYDTITLLKNNIYLIEVTYYDFMGNKYVTKENVKVNLENLEITEQGKIIINNIGKEIRDSPTESSIIIGLMFFTLTIITLFRRRKH